MRFSLIIPVYNRPQEVDELLASLTLCNYSNFEVIVVEDGSDISCRDVVEKYSRNLNIRYYVKDNSGPGPTRNFGAERVSGDYLIFFDSDCLIPENFFDVVLSEMQHQPVDFFGGPDATHPNFSPVQKAIGYTMTSFFTTGGIRGGRVSLERFAPRSFNMGILASAFRQVGGFSNMRFGEDVDLSLRLFENGFKSRLFPKAYVYHKRRSDFRKFFKQVFNSGMARINLSLNHPGTLKLVHLLPSVFVLFMTTIVGISFISPLFLIIPLLYSLSILIDSLVKSKNFEVALLSIVAAWVQLYGYGLGFIYALWLWLIYGQKPQGAFMKSFYH